MFGLSLRDILELSLLGTLVTVAGNLIASWLTGYVFARSFERWKAQQALLSVYRRYKDPIVLAASELYARLKEICDPLCWLHRTSVRKNSSLHEWDPSLVALALLKSGKCRAIERRHECLIFPLLSGHLQGEGNLISHLSGQSLRGFHTQDSERKAAWRALLR
jgi:hypothetical protein